MTATHRMQMPEPGALLCDKFQLLEVLGEGGMGIVYRAHHGRLQRDVAIKLLRPEILLAGYELHRFEREARAAARLQSPHVVRVFDIDTSAEGLPFIVMELLAGTTLAGELSRRGALPIGEAVQYAIECCAALALADAEGIVHRDIKPANIFLAQEERGVRRVKLLDFGITKLGAGETSDQTASGLRLGTMRYASPEQLRSAALADHRSDIWSLGVVIHEMLCGRSPFDADNDADLTIQIMTEEATSLSGVDAAIPVELSSIVQRALHKDRELRFQHTDELASALRSFLASRVGGASPESGTEPTLPAGAGSARLAERPSLEPSAWWTKGRLLWLLPAALVLLAVAAQLVRAVSTNVPPAASALAAPAVSSTAAPAPSARAEPTSAPLVSTTPRTEPTTPERAPATNKQAPLATATARGVAADHDFERRNPYRE